MIDEAWKIKVDNDIASLQADQTELRGKVDEVIDQNSDQINKLDRMLRWQTNATKILWIAITPLIASSGLALLVVVAVYAIKALK